VDEAQDIEKHEYKWIKKLWKKDAKQAKLWVFGDKEQNLNRFLGVTDSLLSVPEEEDIQTLNQQLRTTLEVFERYHKVKYERKEPEYGDTSESIATDEEDVSGSQDGIHCSLCDMKTSSIRGQEVEEKDLGLNVLPEELAKRIISLVNDHKVRVEDIAILCIDHDRIEFLKNRMTSLLIGKGRLTTSTKNLEIVSAEDFATNCSKLRKKGRKRKSTGENTNQMRKFLMIDTVRRFKGLEAEVVILLNELRPTKEIFNLRYVGMSRTISKLIIYNLG